MLSATIHDISPRITRDLAVFPGDTPFRRDVALSFESGGNLLLSSVTTTLHLGAHVDAPNHYRQDGEDIATREVSRYLGACQVVTVAVGRGERIMPMHVSHVKFVAPRVLFKTGTFPDPNHWNGDFAALSSELIDHLHANGVRLVGIDTPSVDPEKDKVLLAHAAIARHDMANLEGIVLDDVSDGVYTLIALPLRIEGADASPVRALLLPKDALTL